MVAKVNRRLTVQRGAAVVTSIDIDAFLLEEELYDVLVALHGRAVERGLLAVV